MMRGKAVLAMLLLMKGSPIDQVPRVVLVFGFMALSD